MGRYLHELWIGKADDYWSWGINGVRDEDFAGRVKLCEEYMAELKSIKAYYKSLIKKVKPRTGEGK